MQLNSSEKKTLTIIAAVAVVFVVIVGVTVAVLTHGSHEEKDRPYLQLAIGDRLTRVDPAQMCDVFLKNCEPARVADVHVPKIPVPVGDAVVLSVSNSIAEFPWKLVTQYWTPGGPVEDTEQYGSGTTYSEVLHSSPDRILINIEVQLPSVVPVSGVPDEDSADTYARGYLAADTTPEGLKLPS